MIISNIEFLIFLCWSTLRSSCWPTAFYIVCISLKRGYFSGRGIIILKNGKMANFKQPPLPDQQVPHPLNPPRGHPGHFPIIQNLICHFWEVKDSDRPIKPKTILVRQGRTFLQVNIHLNLPFCSSKRCSAVALLLVKLCAT